MKQDTLASIGWTVERQHELETLFPGADPARVSAQHIDSYELRTSEGVASGKVPGRLRYRSQSAAELPAVGDWVAVKSTDAGTVVIEGVLNRNSTLSRNVAGIETAEQVIATNIDVLFIVCALDDDFNLRRIERYLSIAWQSGAVPQVILTKSDLCKDVADHFEAVRDVSPGTDVLVVSAGDSDSIQRLRDSIQPTTTIALVGSSGVGKSTLLNLLADEELMVTAQIRENGKGRHTTTHRQLLLLPNGAAAIDTPGMRELQLWDVSDGIESTFEEIEALSGNCHFSDCSHQHEPKCAVREAVETGELPAARLESYEKQLRELTALERRRDKRLARENSRKIGRIMKDVKVRTRHKEARDRRR